MLLERYGKLTMWISKAKTVYGGEPPRMEKFVEFWAGIWEKDEKTPEIPWMEKVKIELREKVQNVNEFTITENKVVAEIRKTQVN